jgi:XTP/dITP diphosphohydrolase
MKKKRQILLGTHNKGKFKELSYLMPKNIEKISPISLKIKSPKETGKTFLANSRLKANYFYKKTNIISLSDDSGLSVSCLKGKPGIYSARWAKKYGGFKNAMKKILFLVKKINYKNKKKNYKATFICCLTLKINKKKQISAMGKINGKISDKILGDKGFGYD